MSLDARHRVTYPDRLACDIAFEQCSSKQRESPFLTLTRGRVKRTETLLYRTRPKGIFFSSVYAFDICDLKCLCVRVRIESGKSTHQFEISTKRRTALGLLHGDVHWAETFLRLCYSEPIHLSALKSNPQPTTSAPRPPP